MITVAILGILAAVALPQYSRYSMRARNAEAYTMLNMAKNQEYAWQALYDCFAPTELHPVGPPGPGRMAFGSVSTVFTDPCDGNQRSLADVGIVPTQSQLYYTYQCNAFVTQAMGPGSPEFSCSAHGDLDGNGVMAEIIYCTDLARTGTGFPSPTGTVCSFPFEVYRASVELF